MYDDRGQMTEHRRQKTKDRELKSGVSLVTDRASANLIKKDQIFAKI